MSTSWRTTPQGGFEIVDRQGLVGLFFGGFMLVISGCFLYWLGVALVELIRHGTWRDWMSSLMGMSVGLLMAGLFGVPGCLMALMSKRTHIDKDNGLIRQVTFYGVFWRKKSIALPRVKQVVAKFRTARRGGAGVHVVELLLDHEEFVSLTQVGKWDAALKLGKDLAAYLGLAFRQM